MQVRVLLWRSEYMKKVRWLEDAVFYNIYPQSFYDTNDDI